jgi:integrase/recombinase XerD
MAISGSEAHTHKTGTYPPVAPLDIAGGFGPLVQQYLAALAIQNYSPRTIEDKHHGLQKFTHWCDTRDIQLVSDIDQALAQRYQSHLHHYRKDDGMNLSADTQRGLLGRVKGFYDWLVKQQQVISNPFALLSMPKSPKRLPGGVLSVADIEKVMQQPNLDTHHGLRDRAMLEVIYSTGIRRAELLNLALTDIDRSRGIAYVRQGKGAKDRIIPIGERALFWVDRYLIDSRPELARRQSAPALFITEQGNPISRGHVTKRFGEYVQAANIGKQGACHIFRHSTATLMLEHGADIRHIQAMLGHESLSTTQIYTQVAIGHLKDVHNRTHPGESNIRKNRSQPNDHKSS